MIQIKDMACPPPRDSNVNEKVKLKLQKYQQLAYKIGERRPEYHIEVISVIIERVGGGENRFRKQMGRVLETNEKQMTMTSREILKIVNAESESMIKKLLANIITAV